MRRHLPSVLLLAILGTGCSSEPDSSAGIAGTWFVTAHTVDPAGCTEGAPDASLETIDVHACEDGRVLVQMGARAPSCGLKGDPFMEERAPGLYVGGSTSSLTMERDGSLSCGATYLRMEASVTGEALILEYRSYQDVRPVASFEDCPDVEQWERGENLPPCRRRERIVAQRID